MGTASENTTWLALLRGVNVGRNKRVAMADLRALLGSLGYGEVRTHLQSGNALFTATGARGRRDAAPLEDTISSTIARELGLDVDVAVYHATELAKLVGANPFLRRGADPKELFVTFFPARSEPPSGVTMAGVDRAAAAPDEFELGDRAIYERLANGVTGSRLPNWQHLLGAPATNRNWKTVTRLHALATGS